MAPSSLRLFRRTRQSISAIALRRSPVVHMRNAHLHATSTGAQMGQEKLVIGAKDERYDRELDAMYFTVEHALQIEALPPSGQLASPIAFIASVSGHCT